jgi:hypothetical protein
MGYRTRFEATVFPSNAMELFLDRLESTVRDGEFVRERLAEEGEGMKWYDCEDDMCKVTKGQPYAVMIDGEGEESADVWRALFRDGKLVWEWKLKVDRPEPPAEHIQGLDCAEGVAMLVQQRRDAVLRRLSPEDRALFGLPDPG